ncbi:MAG: PAS domain-containing sensor histidine kinase [Hyphomonadaceae bacterium]|nr:PAS domain-containing sensor histidine kinase [Hyphomonadaceae bacterium]
MRAPLNTSATRASLALFQGLFFIATLVAVFTTFSAISGVSPVDPLQGRIGWLLAINTVLIAILAWMIVERYRRVDRERSAGGSSRLARRFILLFGAAAIIPASVVAIFLGATITRGLDNWFNERIDTIVEETAAVARRNHEEFVVEFLGDVRLTVGDLNNAAQGLREGSEFYPSYVARQAALRGFSQAYVIDAQGRFLAQPETLPTRLVLPPPSDFTEADEGRIVDRLSDEQGLVTALAALRENRGAYIYVAKPFDFEELKQMRRAEAALTDYRAAKHRSGRLQWLFAVGYGQVAALVLLLSGRLGLEAARHVTGPIGRLAEAATAVRDGDLTVRVPTPAIHDEVHDLTRSFNTMTEQLAQQRSALVLAREDAEDRRQFVETLLAEVSAGVIRTDEDMRITLANRSAEKLLGVVNIQGQFLGDVLPDFAEIALRTIDDESTVDASLDLVLNGVPSHVRMKAALDANGGCVLTFDDATRLVNAQRQLAWRDVARRIAHEIRNPLTPILLSTERLRRRFADKLEPEAKSVFDRCTDTILRQVADIGRMVEEFSNFARMPKPSVAEFDMGSLLTEVAFARGMVQPEIDFVVHKPDGPARYVGDNRLMGQALGNLLKNAAEAIERLPEDTEVAGRIDVTLRETLDGQLEINIEDNGPGFPSEARERLMEPYVTTREKGTGLGLAIVNRIIMDHGGTISLHNRADGRRGARVSILLPHTEMPAALDTETRHELASRVEETTV